MIGETLHDRERKPFALLVYGMVVASLLLLSSLGCDRNDNRGGRMGDNHMMGDDHMMDRQQEDAGEMMGDGGMMGDGSMMGEHMEKGEMPDWMKSRGGRMGGSMMRDMRVIRQLLRGHETIERTVEEIPGGVRTETTSSEPQTAEAIRTHVRQMKERVEEGRPIRQMDPVFREIFRHNNAIEMEIENIEGGVRVVETSANPQVTLLIRQHAKRAVSEFVDEGMRRAMQPTPLPEGYSVE